MADRQKKSAKTLVNSFTQRNGTFKVGDCVLINPDAAAAPFIGRIKEMVQKGKRVDDIEVTVVWFYRPEEAIGGRKVFHGDKELFSSDHLDHVHKDTIIGHCRVHSLKNYEKLTRIENNDYFTRFTYKPATKEFEPDRVPVYCTCEQPYNPDRPMVRCDHCEEWYHPECLKLPKNIVKNLGGDDKRWVCPECNRQAAATANKRPRGDDDAAGGFGDSQAFYAAGAYM